MARLSAPRSGGLLSRITDIYVSIEDGPCFSIRALKRAKPADLPVVQSTKFEFVINLGTAGRSALRCRQICSPSPTR
jgi:hypothetical protein